MADRIELTGLECFGYHGVFEEEKRTGQPFTFYMAAAAIFLAFTVVSDIARHRLERRANRGVRRA